MMTEYPMPRHREAKTGTPPISSPARLDLPPFSMAFPKEPTGPKPAQRPRENSSIMPDWLMTNTKMK